MPSRPVAAISNPKPAIEPATVEEFRTLFFEVAGFKPKIRRLEDLRKLILSSYSHLPGDRSELVEGIDWNVLVSICDNKRWVTPAGLRKLYKLWGAAEFFNRCSVALSELPDKDDPQNLYTMQARVGSRHLEPTPRLAKAA